MTTMTTIDIVNQIRALATTIHIEAEAGTGEHPCAAMATLEQRLRNIARDSRQIVRTARQLFPNQPEFFPATLTPTDDPFVSIVTQ